MDSESAEAPPLEIETAPQPDASIIWLHGLGADGSDFESLVPALPLPASLKLRFVFPHAPFRPVSLNQGYVMRAWYDIALRDGVFIQNLDDIRASIAILEGLIQREQARGVESKRIVLAGFSQGGVIALHTGLGFAQPLAGILALSVPLPSVNGLIQSVHPANGGIPIFMAHGTEDPMVPFAVAQRSYEELIGQGLKITWRQYPMGHHVSTEEISDIAQWLVGVL